MRRIVVVPLAVLVLAIVASQLFGPGIAERRVEHRLERHGGTAHVSISALPAARLLFHDGDSLTVRGRGLRLDEEERSHDLEGMDGFDKVSVELQQLRTGPLNASSFSMTRGEGERTYGVRIRGSTTAAELGSFLGGTLGGVAGGLLGGSEQLPVRVRASIASHGGDVQVRSAAGTVAGIPADPLIQFVAAAVASRI
jgi:hypothetical protein